MAFAAAVSFGQEADTAVKAGRQIEIACTAHRIVTVNAPVEPGESVVILTDPEVSPMIVDGLAMQTAVVGGVPLVLRMPPLPVHGRGLPAPVAAALGEANVIYAAVSRSITSTQAAQDACRRGARYLGLSNITEDSFLYGAASADPIHLRDVGRRIREKLLASRSVRVTSGYGTDVSFSITGRRVTVGDSIISKGSRYPENRRMFPDGEVYCCPLEDSANGRIVVDRWMQGVGLLQEPITWEFRDGVCVRITGGPEAQTLARLLDEQGDEYSRRLGEFAIGINPMARDSGNPHREGKKLWGSCHFALGTGTGTGGIYQSRLHLDGLLRSPVIVLDGEVLFDRGTLSQAVSPAADRQATHGR